jgi:glutamyl-tRNA reductase
MQLLALGLNHQTAPLAVRERMAFLPEDILGVITRMQERFCEIHAGKPFEAAIVSTCNRTEVYCAVANADAARAELTQFLASEKGVNPEDFAKASYALPHGDAVRHAFRVASGLDSMVLGEPQILGQMKQAERLAREAGGLGLMLNHLFQNTFSVAKEVRSSTEIGAHSVSMAAAATKLAERIFGDLGQCHLLFIGAGEMIELASTHFAARHPKSITVANRTLARAHTLASHLHGQALSLADIADNLHRFDVVVSCTGSALPIVGLGMVERAVKTRRHRPMVIVDLAVPRDVESEVARLDDVFVYTVDDLGKMVQLGHESRRAAVAQAEAIIEARVRDFESWFAGRATVPVIQGIRQKADAVRRHELERAKRLLAKGESTELVLEKLSQSLMNKYLHAPLAALNDASNAPGQERDQTIDMISRLFGERSNDGSSS